MNHFTEQLGQRARLSPEQAKATVEFLTEYFKTNLPAPVVEQIMGTLKGSPAATLAPVAAIKP